MTYMPGQVRNVFSCVDFVPSWFVVGGPADGDEAQVFCKKYAGCKALGVEPVSAFCNFQHDFPGELLCGALWSESGSLLVRAPAAVDEMQKQRSTSAVRPYDGESHQVQAYTLDELHSTRQFYDAVLWLDVEGAEYQILLGAQEMLKATVLINLEVFSDEELLFKRLLRKHKFKEVKRWGEQTLGMRTMWNAVYRRQP